MRFPIVPTIALCLPWLAACSEKRKPADSETTSETAAPAKAPEGMILIPGGSFQMGSQFDSREGTMRVGIGASEGPLHRVILEPFYMDETEVTNAQFKAFVDATGYVTTRRDRPVDWEELHLDQRELPRPTPPNRRIDVNYRKPDGIELLFGAAGSRHVDLRDFFQWWIVDARRGLAPSGWPRQRTSPIEWTTPL